MRATLATAAKQPSQLPASFHLGRTRPFESVPAVAVPRWGGVQESLNRWKKAVRFDFARNGQRLYFFYEVAVSFLGV